MVEMTGSPLPVLAARLNRIIEVLHRRDREPATNAEVAASVSAGRRYDPGERITPTALTVEDVAALRAGEPVEDAAPKLAAIAAYFGLLDTRYLWASRESQVVRDVTDQLRLFELLRDNPGLSLHACRGSDPGSLRAGDLVALFEYALTPNRQTTSTKEREDTRGLLSLDVAERIASSPTQRRGSPDV